MNIKDRIKIYADYTGITIKDFETRSDMSNGYVGAMRKGLGDEKLNNVLMAFPDLSREWLLYGEGKMLKDADKDEEVVIEYVPLLPISAQGGTLNEFVVSVGMEGCEKIISPVKGADFAMEVTGDSMFPEYPSGSRILIKKINEKAFIDWGRVYVLDTCNGSVIKRIFPATEPDKIKCVSINEEYPPFEVAFEDIYGIYRVMLCMSIK